MKGNIIIVIFTALMAGCEKVTSNLPESQQNAINSASNVVVTGAVLAVIAALIIIAWILLRKNAGH